MNAGIQIGSFLAKRPCEFKSAVAAIAPKLKTDDINLAQLVAALPDVPAGENHAIDVNRHMVPFEIMGMAGQEEMANSARGPDRYHYAKIVQVR